MSSSEEPSPRPFGDLSGRVAVVTGAAQGIGRGIALALAEGGAAVVASDREESGASKQLLAELGGFGVRRAFALADVRDRSQLELLFDVAEREIGVADIVVASAGSSIRRPVLEATDEQILNTFDVLVLGAFRTLQIGAQRLIRARRPGGMVAVGSIHAEYPFPNSLSYNVAKAGLHHLVRTMAAELLRARIAVNVVVPGLTDTPGERAFRSEEEMQTTARALPMGRLGAPIEVGRLIRFLMSPENGHMTGSVVLADGGLSVSLGVSGLEANPGGREL